MKARRKRKPLPSPERFEKNIDVAIRTLGLIKTAAVDMGIPVGKVLLTYTELFARMKRYGPECLDHPGFQEQMDKELQEMMRS